MVKVKGPVYFLVYETGRGIKRFKIKINPRKLSPRSEALEKLPAIAKKVQKRNQQAKNFKIEEVLIFERNSL